ncbi:site-specific integrase [Methylomonas montana]|uniref:site-specific integrase n=1 Tax=Methylomonas montana TaxID=3058963 RepID=UPI002659DFB1|nr:site-specific integrase [Methylomonas montana]WKJ91367.1 site-specific integrase [Methylomonas montana]
MLPVPKRRIRFLTQDQARQLLTELPPHLADMPRFSLETGLRQANVIDLQWSQVDLARRCAWIHPDQAKARRAIAVPLSPAAVDVVQAQLGKHQAQVFSYKGKPVTVVNTKAWRAALKRAGIEDFRWHDLRHTWASWHAQAGTPLNVLQELGAWESVEMVRRYAHLSGEHLAEYARSMIDLSGAVATN